ncbi:MAG: LytTR family DNA-binding domain-containing protein [Thomasclavelia sp.]|uniref:LytTR family DNA-binding domain-containing protein n=1 Tax=Thomasclavelia sp. TaxID=3025757 RepID=UPI0039A34CD6
MKIKVIKDDSYQECEILIYTDNEIKGKELVEYLNMLNDQIKGYYRDEIVFLNQNEILYIYTSNNKVYASCNNREYLLKYRLYELEIILNDSFIRISNCQIVNKQYIQSFKREGIKTVAIVLKNNIKLYISRRYLGIVKKRIEG